MTLKTLRKPSMSCFAEHSRNPSASGPQPIVVPVALTQYSQWSYLFSFYQSFHALQIDGDSLVGRSSCQGATLEHRGGSAEFRDTTDRT